MERVAFASKVAKNKDILLCILKNVIEDEHQIKI